MPDTPMTPTTGVYSENRQPLETRSSGVAWPAIIGGASATTFATITAVWLIVTQWLASGGFPRLGAIVCRQWDDHHDSWCRVRQGRGRKHGGEPDGNAPR